MGTSLNGLTPAGTYPGLIKTGDNAPIDGTLKTLSDGNGNNLPMAVSTTTINLTGTAQVGGVGIANTTQVAAKQDTLVSGTNIKTVNSTSLLGSGNVAVQDVLVSGTNIKTINSTSLLGSGNIAVVTSPSGVAGAIQFSDGSAFSSDATNFFWNNTTKRLGVGTNAPSVPFEVLGNAWVNAVASADATFSIGNPTRRWDVKALQSGAYYQVVYNNGLIGQSIDFQGNVAFGNVATLGARVGIRGSGSTSATTSLLVQNSSAVASLQVLDDTSVFNNGKGAVASNTAFGKGALIANSTGSSNSAFGQGALEANTTGSNNHAFGQFSMYYSGTGSNNVAIGTSALQNNSSGSGNVAIGIQSLITNSSGSDNSALGRGTVSGNFSGSLILGKDATATANNQFVVGSSTTNAGAVNSTSDVPATFLWSVRINGTNYKILMTT